MNQMVYVAGALTKNPGVEIETPLYEAIAQVCELFHFKAYVPHLSRSESDSDALDFQPQEIFAWDIDHVSRADLLIASVSSASLGVGIELGHAACLGIPVVTLCRRGVNLSPMVLGHPLLIKHIEFETWEEAQLLLIHFLREYYCTEDFKYGRESERTVPKTYTDA